jgi:hypothetical protein
LQIDNATTGKKFLTLNIPIDDIASKSPFATITYPRINHIVFQPIYDTEISGKKIIDYFTAGDDAFVYTEYFKTGSISATASVTLRFYRGTGEEGELFFERVYPASQFPVDSETMLDLVGGISLNVGEAGTLVLESDENFSLLGNNSNQPWRAVDLQAVDLEDVLSHPTGLDRIISTENSIVVDNFGNLILRNYDVFT